jgi:hypothetical protein
MILHVPCLHTECVKKNRAEISLQHRTFQPPLKVYLTRHQLIGQKKLLTVARGLLITIINDQEKDKRIELISLDVNSSQWARTTNLPVC